MTEWFTCNPIGINQLQNCVKELSKKAGFDGHYTNHSLRATSATRMYNADIPEQVICEVTGHRSMAVREYKQTGIGLKRQASAALGCPIDEKSNNLVHN